MILYSTGCPNCSALKLLLKKYKLQFTEENSVDEMARLGIMEVPMLRVDEKLLNFNEAKKWIMKEVSNEKQ